MTGFPLLTLNPTNLERVINKLQPNSYFHMQQSCRAVFDFIQKSRNISVHLWGRYNLTDRRDDSFCADFYSRPINIKRLYATRPEILCPPRQRNNYPWVGLEDPFELFRDCLKENRITCNELHLVEYDKYGTEQWATLINILRPVKIALDGRSTDRYGALLQSKTVHPGDVINAMLNQKKNKKVRPGQRAAATAAPKPTADEPIESIYSSDEVSSDEWHEETFERPTPGGGYVIESFGSNLSAMRREKEGGKKKKRTAAAKKPEVFSKDRIKSAEMELSEKFGLGVSLSYIGDNPMFNPQMMKKSGKDYGQAMREFAAQNPKHSGKPAPLPKPLNFLELDSRLQKKICSKIPNFDSFEHMRQCSRVANVACEEVIRDGTASFKPLHQGEQLDDVVEDFENIDDMYYNIIPGHLGKVIFGGYDEMRQGAVETVKKALSRGPHIQLDIPSLVLDTYDVEELLPRLISGHSSIRTLGVEATAISVDQFNQLCGQVKIEEVYLLHTEHTQRKNFLSCPNIGKLNKLRVRLYNQEMLLAMAPHPPRAITAIHTCTLSFDGMHKFLEEYIQGKREITCLDIHYANLDGCDFEKISRKMKAMHTMTPQKKYRLNRDKKNYVMINITKEQRQSPTGPSRITRVVLRKISH